MLLALVAMGNVSVAGCSSADAGDSPDPEELRMQEIRERVATHQPVHVDSVHPPEEEMRRFREGLPEPDGLRGGTRSRDLLVDGLIQALEAADTAAVARLAMSRPEFAWFYYPHSIYTSPPYILPPSLVWYQMQNRSSGGLTRLLRRYAGETLHYTGYACPDDGEAWGEGRLWNGCTVLGELPTGERVEERIFGGILEMEGHYKFVSYANEL